MMWKIEDRKGSKYDTLPYCPELEREIIWELKDKVNELVSAVNALEWEKHNDTVATQEQDAGS